jgi:hypothetical protein
MYPRELKLSFWVSLLEICSKTASILKTPSSFRLLDFNVLLLALVIKNVLQSLYNNKSI